MHRHSALARPGVTEAETVDSFPSQILTFRGSGQSREHSSITVKVMVPSPDGQQLVTKTQNVHFPFFLRTPILQDDVSAQIDDKGQEHQKLSCSKAP